MTDKLVSIIIPLYNVEKYITDTLESVLNQSYKYWECLIIDDGSTDSTKNIAEEYCKMDNRFKYHYKNNSGPSSARNLGIKLSSGDFIQFLDADDVIKPEMLQIMVNESKKVEKKIILYSNLSLGNSVNIYKTTPFRKKTNLGKDINFNDMYRKFGLEFLFIPSCVLFPKKVFDDGVRWNEQLNHSEDWDLYLQISFNKYVFRYLHETLVIYRNTPNSLSKDFLNTIYNNYLILNSWVNNDNLFFFSIRCALLYKRNIKLFLLKKTGRIIHPHSIFKGVSFKLSIFMITIYPITGFYFFIEAFNKLYIKYIK